MVAVGVVVGVGVAVSLYPPQLAAIQPALSEKTRRYILNWEMGTGKSVGAVEIINHFDPASVLVVCPALVRSKDWPDAFKKFYYDYTEDRVGVISFGRRKSLTKKQKAEFNAAYERRIQIISADLLEEAHPGPWSLVIIDELHQYKNEKAVRSKQLRALLEANPQAYVLGLTGTLAPNDVGDIWNPIDLLWPGRVGTKWAFRNRYQNQRQKIINEETGESRIEFYGLNEDNAAELSMRLAAMSSRVTRKDVAEYLPAFDIRLLTVEQAKLDWKLVGNTKSDIDYALEQAAKAKIDYVVDWVVSKAETTDHIAVLAHHKNIAWCLAERIATKLPLRKVVYADGETVADKRITTIEEAKAADQAILVGTIQSMGVGISLTKFTQAIFAEFHWSPGVMEQVLLRFSRLDSMIPSQVWFTLVPGTIDEVIATRLEEKFKAINPVVATGLVGGSMTNLLQLNEDDFLRGIAEAALELENDE